jgi:hypothetical protein
VNECDTPLLPRMLERIGVEIYHGRTSQGGPPPSTRIVDPRSARAGGATVDPVVTQRGQPARVALLWSGAVWPEGLSVPEAGQMDQLPGRAPQPSRGDQDLTNPADANAFWV